MLTVTKLKSCAALGVNRATLLSGNTMTDVTIRVHGMYCTAPFTPLEMRTIVVLYVPGLMPNVLVPMMAVTDSPGPMSTTAPQHRNTTHHEGDEDSRARQHCIASHSIRPTDSALASAMPSQVGLKCRPGC